MFSVFTAYQTTLFLTGDPQFLMHGRPFARPLGKRSTYYLDSIHKPVDKRKGLTKTWTLPCVVSQRPNLSTTLWTFAGGTGASIDSFILDPQMIKALHCTHPDKLSGLPGSIHWGGDCYGQVSPSLFSLIFFLCFSFHIAVGWCGTHVGFRISYIA